MGGVVLVLVCMAVVWVVICKKKKKKKKKKGGAEVAEGEVGVAGGGGEEEGGFAWENEGVGKLVFCGGGDREMSYSFLTLPLKQSLTPNHVHTSVPSRHGSLLRASMEDFNARSACESSSCDLAGWDRKRQRRKTKTTS